LGDEELWRWWQTSGRTANSFDMHLRLAHLRNRLTGLLELPEYGVLWRPPFLDPLESLLSGQTLLWRLPNSRRRLRPYISSQLLGLSSLLAAWPADRPPLLLFLHELELGHWADSLQASPMAQLVLSARRFREPALAPTALLVSRLEDEDAERVAGYLPSISPTDLRRLPSTRLLLQRGAAVGTLDMV
jgi:hypothetical protein